MQHVRVSVLRHVRLSCSSGLPEFAAGGGLPVLPCGLRRRMACMPASNSEQLLTARVIELVKKYDKIDASKVTETADFQKDLCLDSLDRVELVMAIEQEFSVEIPDDKADKMSCCSDVVKYLSENQSTGAESS